MEYFLGIGVPGIRLFWETCSPGRMFQARLGAPAQLLMSLGIGDIGLHVLLVGQANASVCANQTVGDENSRGLPIPTLPPPPSQRTLSDSCIWWKTYLTLYPPFPPLFVSQCMLGE